MTRKEIVRSISEDLGLSQSNAKEIIQKVFDAILRTLAEDGRVELRNFGVFEVKRRRPRKARNPRTGERVFVPEKLVVTFKAGRIVQQRVEALGNGVRRASDASDPLAQTRPTIPFRPEGL
jgi:nucleoid DNA-binding protein